MILFIYKAPELRGWKGLGNRGVSEVCRIRRSHVDVLWESAANSKGEPHSQSKNTLPGNLPVVL